MWEFVEAVGGAVFLFSLVFVLVSSFFTFDKLVRLQYEAHRSYWERDGGPRGFFWWAPGTRKWFRINLRSEWAFQRTNLRWFFSTPNWMRKDPQAVRLVRRFRLLVLIWNLGILLLLTIGPTAHLTGY